MKITPDRDCTTEPFMQPLGFTPTFFKEAFGCRTVYWAHQAPQEWPNKQHSYMVTYQVLLKKSYYRRPIFSMTKSKRKSIFVNRNNINFIIIKTIITGMAFLFYDK